MHLLASLSIGTKERARALKHEDTTLQLVFLVHIDWDEVCTKKQLQQQQSHYFRQLKKLL